MRSERTKRERDSRDLPAIGDPRADVPPLESQVRRDEPQRGSAAARAGRRKPRLKHIVADLTLENRAIKDVLGRKW